jgi:hypothetical protein
MSRCQRGCGRHAATGHRICHVCHDRQVAREEDHRLHRGRGGTDHSISRRIRAQAESGRIRAQAANVQAMIDGTTKKP